MLEIEIKARCADMVSLERKLIDMGAVSEGIRRERDLYYNHPSRDFAITDEAFRVRSAGEYCALTYKGPKLEGRSKTRFEAEVEIGDAGLMGEVLDRLGFHKVRAVEKERKMYRLGDITVCLDRVAGLGDFAEIEKIGEDRGPVEAELFALAEVLGLRDFERRSYLELLLLNEDGRGR